MSKIGSQNRCIKREQVLMCFSVLYGATNIALTALNTSPVTGRLRDAALDEPLRFDPKTQALVKRLVLKSRSGGQPVSTPERSELV